MFLNVNYHSWSIKDVSILESEYNLNLHKLFKKKIGLAVLIRMQPSLGINRRMLKDT
jgi:hypothetical protein